MIQPDEDPAVFDDTNVAKQQLQNGQVDAIVADLPTAFYITAVEIPKATIVGQFQPETGRPEEFGMLFEKGSELRPVRQPGARRRSRRTAPSTHIEQEWLSDVVERARAAVTGPAVTGLAAEPARARAPAGPPVACATRSLLVAIATVVVLLRAARASASCSSPGWPTVQETFFDGERRPGVVRRRSSRASGST